MSKAGKAQTPGGEQRPGGRRGGRSRAAPITLTLRVSLVTCLPRGRTGLAVPVWPAQYPLQGAQRDRVGQECTPRLLTSLLPKLPSRPAPAVATPGPSGLVRCRPPAAGTRHPPPGGVCSPTARPRARPGSPVAFARGFASLLRATGSHARLPSTSPTDPGLTSPAPISALTGADG